MLTVQDIPADDRLPHLAVALDRSAIHAVLQKTLFTARSDAPAAGHPHSQLYIQDCQIERIKYKPGKSCIICYRLAIWDALRQEKGEQILCARMFARQEEVLSRFLSAQAQRLVRPKFGNPLVHIPELNMIVWAFPNDHKLGALPTLTSPSCLQYEILPEVIATTCGQTWCITALAMDVVNYVPQYTCAVQVRVYVQEARTQARKSMVLYGKTYYNVEGAYTYRIMRELWESDARRYGHLHLAQPLGYDAQQRILWQLGLPGTTLLTQDMHSPHFLTLIGRAATTVATLHQAPVTCARPLHISDALVRVQEMQRVLAQVRPSCQESLQTLIERLLSQAEQLVELPGATLHGDLHLNNFLVHGEQVALIDMDSLGQGSPLRDLGSFLAFLVYRGLLMGISEQVIEKIGEVFVQHYEKRVPWKISRSALKWYIAMSLINERTYSCLTRLRTGRLDILDSLVQLATRISLRWDSPGLLASEKQ